MEVCETSQAPTLLASLSRNSADFATVKFVSLEPLADITEASTSGSEAEALCRWCEYAASAHKARAKRGAKGRRTRQEYMGGVAAGIDVATPQEARNGPRCATCAAAGIDNVHGQLDAETPRADAARCNIESCFAWLATLMFDSESRSRLSAMLCASEQ